MTWQKWLTKWLPVLNILITISLSFYAAWLQLSLYNLQSSLYNLQVASTRADVSILFNPALDQNWTFVTNGAYLTVNGTLSNEGSRTAIIEEMELSMVYNISDGKYTITMTYLDPSKVCGWNNDTISKNEPKPFHLTMYINTYIWTDPSKAQSIAIGSSRSNEISIYVKYNDGKGELSNTQEFNTTG